MKIILSTRNPSKAHQIKAFFGNSDSSAFKILTLDEAGIKGEGVEDGATLEENSFKKALYAHQKAADAVWTMADDTGLFIDALKGAPGIKAARWAGENATTAEITAHTLRQLEGVTNRSATFETVVTIMAPSGSHRFFKGAVRGKILTQEKVPPQPKMPYSGIFMPDGSDLVWAEMSAERENSISHRGKAFTLVRSYLEDIL